MPRSARSSAPSAEPAPRDGSEAAARTAAASSCGARSAPPIDWHGIPRRPSAYSSPTAAATWRSRPAAPPVDNPLAEPLRHNAWATRQLLDTARRLTPEQLVATVPGTFGSVLATLQ